MSLRAQLTSLVDELRLLKEEGIDAVYVEDSTLAGLQQATARLAEKAKPPAAPVSNSAPVEQIVLKEPPMLKSPSAKAPTVTIDRGAPEEKNNVAAPTPFTLPEGTKEERMSWLREKVLNCPECKKHVRPGCKIVFGVGSVDADIFFCGEAPGADEELKGEPFVGRAGQLLTKIIQATGLKREEVYIGNIMNWRPEMPIPTGNRPPNAEEMAFCLPYLKAQVEIVSPKVIVALGSTAAKGLLGEEGAQPMRDIRGKWFDFEGTPVIVTYHPSYLLRNGTNRTKRIVWEDILAVMEKVDMPISEKQKGFFLEKR